MKKHKAKAAPRRKTKAKLSQSEIMRTKGVFFVHPDALTSTGKVDKTVESQIAALPFVRSPKRGEKGGRCFWSVKAIGNYAEDYAQGQAYARRVLALLKYNIGMTLVSLIVLAMIKAGKRVALCLASPMRLPTNLRPRGPICLWLPLPPRQGAAASLPSTRRRTPKFARFGETTERRLCTRWRTRSNK